MSEAPQSKGEDTASLFIQFCLEAEKVRGEKKKPIETMDQFRDVYDRLLKGENDKSLRETYGKHVPSLVQLFGRKMKKLFLTPPLLKVYRPPEEQGKKKKKKKKR